MIWVGTSGYNYVEWKGRFYPSDLPAKKMLAFYASRFQTVEINYTFYRMPNASTLEGWLGETPAGFTFTLKAPRRITHDRRLRDCAELVSTFCERAAILGDRLGVVLFQLAPTFKIDLPLFDAFLETLPPGLRATFEFRHPSWHDDQVFERLRRRNLALCIADSEERSTPRVSTASYGYLRLRDEGYGEEDLREWAAFVAGQTEWKDVFVYFKHEDEGKGPEFAAAFMEAVKARM